MKYLLIVCLLAALPLTAAASKPGGRAPKKEPAEKQPSPEEQAARDYEAALDFKQGRVELPGGVAVLNVPEGFRYLGPEQADKLLVEVWGNPPGENKSLGMLFPSDVSPLAEEGWGVVITYYADGHVSDEDASGLDYGELLEQMKKETAVDNPARREKGYEPVTLVGWAARPHYDTAAHKLYWAKELSFGNTPEHTLNYDIRVLGRQGVLSFNAVAGMHLLPQVEESMKEVLSFADFKPGQRYADFQPKTDRLAAYGIGALIAGKLAAKAGFFKLALAAVLAAKKFVIMAFVALGGLVARLFRRQSS